MSDETVIRDFVRRDDRATDDLILACDCGNTTFYVRLDGEIECSTCGELVSDEPAENPSGELN